MMKTSLAYLLGAYLSDGTLGWHGRNPRASWQIGDESFADCIALALDTIGVQYIRREGIWKCAWKGREKLIPYYSVKELSSGHLGNWLWKVSGEKERLPKIPQELVRPLVAGLMDGDGCISIIYEGSASEEFRLSFSGEKGFVEDFRDLLTSLGVAVGTVQYDTMKWSINLPEFLDAGLCFAMPRKQERLVRYCHKKLQKPHRPGYEGWAGWEYRAEVAEKWLREVSNLNLWEE